MQLGRKRRTPLGWPAKTMLIMKLTAILMLVFSFQVNANIFSQKVTLEEKGASLQKIFRQIHRQTGYQFFYQDDLLDKYGKVDISVRNVELQEALKKCFNGLPLTFQVVNKTIIVNAQQNSQNVVVTPEVIEEPAPPPAEVRGIVLNEKSEPLEGISVMIKGTQRGTVTRAGGLFNLTDVNDNDILIFTGVNIETQEVAIRGRAALSVYVKTKVSQLDEVQVIGYGKTTQRLSTSSVSSIKAEAIEKQPVANPIQALQGRMAGVAITQTGGSIGSGVDIQVRGVGTIQSGNQPLIIVDGAILPEAHNGLGTALGGYMTFGSTSMNTINPADIESIDVLKDADATAIYGSRGANGVILITTKKAKLGTTRVTADISTWINSPAYMPEAMSLPQYLQMRRDAFAMGNHNPTTGTAINPITPNANNAPDLLVWDTTKATTYWPDFEYGNRTPSLNAQLSLSGGDRRLNFYASGAYQKQNDITRGSPFQERISANLGINHTSANDRLRVNLNTSFISTELQPSRGGATGGTLASMPPNMPMENEDGSPWWPPTNITQNSLLLNPMATEEAQTSNLTSNFIANLDLTYKIYKGISFKTLFGYNYQQGKSTSTTPSTSINPLNPGSTVPSSSTTSNSFRSFNFEPQLTYTGKISRGKIDALLGSTFFDRQRDNYNLQLAGYTSDLLLYSWSAASTVNSRTNSSSVYRFNSVFSRVNYNWDNKYLINLTYRRDGSSRFGPKKQWGDFWAVGGAWLFTNEEWMKYCRLPLDKPLCLQPVL
ncbi:MAG: SusC/RagA family TonB-linked outer membrane protein [Chitinophagaceae bacterium]|nr:SusC/RagA family TonB-linked outer membrane protein [Chitinophagaceae bacterium]